MEQTKSELNVDKLVNMVSDFMSNTFDGDSNPETAELLRITMMQLLVKVTTVLHFDRMTIVARNESMDKYLLMYEFTKEKGFADHASEINLSMGQCVNTLYMAENSAKKAFLKEIGQELHLYSTSYSEVKTVLEDVGFTLSEGREPKELFVYASALPELLFTYTTFEKYDGSLISESDLKLLALICKLVDSKIQSMVQYKKNFTEVAMKTLILENEKFPMAVIQKSTMQVLSFNNLYRILSPNAKKGGVCYEFLDKTKRCKNCCIDKDALFTDKENFQWVKKAIPFTLANGKEAYLIYAKSSADYVNQLTAVDSLTNAILPRGYEEYYKTFVQRSQQKYAVCTLDVDKFKVINTVFGYDVGNVILKKIADVIRGFIDSHENFSRLGEDKFSIFLHYNTFGELHIKFRKLIALFEEMKQKEFHHIKITIAVGVTLVDTSQPLNILLDQAATARKTVKGSLKSTFSYYNSELDLQLQKEMELEERIPKALANHEFVAYLQPKFDIQTEKICGAEALVRWITPEKMIFPDTFIPLFEKNGFITTLDFIIYEQVIQYIRNSLDAGLPVYPISVNVSRNHMANTNFANDFMKLINKYDVPKEYLELEITESVFVEDTHALQNFIETIKEKELKVSIDDFGTAYSSLQSLTDIQADILKIDKGFLDNIDFNLENGINKDKILIKNIIQLAKEMEFHVICEGIETQEQVEFLKNVGCEHGQGYVFARPMSIKDYDEKFIMV
ncbi:MAG: bifunctional diguanylate cyclase/phosphodiesterase [Bacillota bacterium]